MLATKKKSLKVGRLVSTEHANNVIRNYKQERWIHNSKRIGKEDSLSVWYSIEELEEFLAKAKDHGADGLRMCFGVYGNDFEEKPGYAGRQTIVMVATKETDSTNGESRKDVFYNSDKGPSILAYNVGGVCPPFCTYDGDLGITILDKGEDGLVIR